MYHLYSFIFLFFTFFFITSHWEFQFYCKYCLVFLLLWIVNKKKIMGKNWKSTWLLKKFSFTTITICNMPLPLIVFSNNNFFLFDSNCNKTHDIREQPNLFLYFYKNLLAIAKKCSTMTDSEQHDWAWGADAHLGP